MKNTSEENYIITNKVVKTFCVNKHIINVIMYEIVSGKEINMLNYTSMSAKETVDKYFINKYGLKENSLMWSFKGKGKPYIANYPKLCFNISHSENFVVCVFSNIEIGVDVELTRKIEFEHIVAKVFHKEEIRYVYTSNRDTELRFFEIWTRKESYLKKLGEGLSVDMKKINSLDLKDNMFIMFNHNNYLITISV